MNYYYYYYYYYYICAILRGVMNVSSQTKCNSEDKANNCVGFSTSVFYSFADNAVWWDKFDESLKRPE
jgi:hypothetical protein